MRTQLARYRDLYGSRPLHLLTMLGGFALAGYVVATFKPVTLWNPQVWWQSIAVWFAAAIVLHDLVLFPVYALADRLLAIPAERRRRRRGEPLVPALNYIRVPTLASGLMLVVFLPGIIEQGAPTYLAATGQTQEPFLGRWLLLTAAMFATSAVVYAIRIALAHRRTRTSRRRTGTPHHRTRTSRRRTRTTRTRP
ncbi:MAG TPA: hypothetical protein VLZ05_20790 [Mycobacterium sp.]|nr:hypothetical protein [Mycobacterium sp.]HUH71092.1 hypothetical protein [Mycobacterium sp.]